MKNKFNFDNIKSLGATLAASSVSNDLLISFLDKFDFELIYRTQDDTVVFDTGNTNSLTIEIYNLENPVARQVQVSYWEAGEYFILDTHRLMCAGN